MIKGIKHIIFDLGNVLLNIDPGLTYMALADLQIPDFENFYHSLLQQNIFEDLEVNKISAQQFIDIIKQTAQIPLQDQSIINAWNALLLDFPIRRLQLLQQLQLHYDLILLSNTNEIHEEQFNRTLYLSHGIPNIGVFFDKVFYSHKVGMRKPASEIFELVLNQCSFNPQHTLFIDDLEQNTIAAARLGIQTIWLKEGMSIEKDIFVHPSNS
ncbi:MAG: HAD family phosphatase [Phycisphaerales bacterium]|nr:HAD family phosphatase [Phycisphaerales bacterium]